MPPPAARAPRVVLLLPQSRRRSRPPPPPPLFCSSSPQSEPPCRAARRPARAAASWAPAPLGVGTAGRPACRRRPPRGWPPAARGAEDAAGERAEFWVAVFWSAVGDVRVLGARLFPVGDPYQQIWVSAVGDSLRHTDVVVEDDLEARGHSVIVFLAG